MYFYLLDKLNARKAGVVRGIRPHACPPPPLRRRVDDMTADDLCCIIHIKQVVLIVARVRISVVRGRGVLVAITRFQSRSFRNDAPCASLVDMNYAADVALLFVFT